MLPTRTATRGLLQVPKKTSLSFGPSSPANLTRFISSTAFTRPVTGKVAPQLTRRSIRNPSSPLFRRSFSASTAVCHGHITPPKPGEELYVTFIDKEGDEHKLAVSAGDNLLEIAQEHDIEMEGACEGSCSCSTCHIIVEDEETFDKIPEATDEENDMLDLAFGLTETSRLGCQIVMSPELDGLRVKLPNATRNLQASDFNKK